MNRPRRKCKQPLPLSGVLQEVLKTSGLEKKVREFAALSEWAGIVGARVAEQATPLDIKGGILFLQVKNAAWRSQLAFFKDDIIQKVNEKAGKKIVRTIFFT